MSTLAWYYDWTPDKHLSDDPDGESILCWLCSDCAADLGNQVSLAGSEDVSIGRACDVCAATEETEVTPWPPIF